ncbi:MAG: hypothetical protein HYT94_04040 [Parcubacteria group bacterium]|nr:hypothetical protein [Parcubacteria group bacterium]
MWNFLDKLRAMPEEARKRVGLFLSAVFTGILLVSWMVFPVPHFGSLTAEEKERKSAENLLAPFSALGNEIGVATDGIKDSWSSLSGTASVIKAKIEAKNATSSFSATTSDEKSTLLSKRETAETAGESLETIASTTSGESAPTL